MGAVAIARTKTLARRVAVAAAVWLGLTSAVWTWGDPLAGTLIPLYRWSFTQLTPHYQIRSLRVEQASGERVFALRARTTGARNIAGHSVPDGTEVSSVTLAGHAFQPVIVLIGAAMLWPVRARAERISMVLFALPLLILVEMIDVPLVLAGALEDVVLFNVAPDQLSASLLVQAMNYMNNGGRLALSLVAVGLMVAATRRLFVRR